MSEHSSEQDIQKIGAIRRKPVSQMTGKELAFIHKHSVLTPSEKQRLKYLIDEKKQRQASMADAFEMAVMFQSEMNELDDPYSGEVDELIAVNEMMSARANSATGALISEIGYDAADLFADEFGQEAPPSSREIEEAKDSLLPTPQNDTFAHKLKKSIVKIIHEPILVITMVLLVMLVLFIRPFYVPSGSMRPTLVEGDRILSIAQYFPSGSTYQRGDIVCFTAPNGTVYVKRIVGIGGDHIQISGEKVYVNGEESPYQGTGGVITSMDIQLADDEYWVMGDNRGNSEDSRFIGPIKADKMISKVIAIFAPADHATFL